LTCRCLWLGQFPGQRRSPTLPAHKPLHSLNLVLDWDSIVFEKGRGKLEAYVSNCGYADGLAQTKIESIKFCACGGCWSAIVEGQCFKQGRYPADKSTHVHSVNSRLGHDHALGCTCKTPDACLRPNVSRPHCTADGTCHHALHRAPGPAGRRCTGVTGHLHATCFEAIVEVTGRGCEKCKLKASRKRVKQCCKQ
jgi:hypothetical protein